MYLGLHLRDHLGWHLRVHLGSHLGEHRRRQPINGSPRTRTIRDRERTLVNEPNYVSRSIVKRAEDGDVGGENRERTVRRGKGVDSWLGDGLSGYRAVIGQQVRRLLWGVQTTTIGSGRFPSSFPCWNCWFHRPALCTINQRFSTALKETETTDPRRSRSTPTSCISSSCRRFTALSCDCKLVMSCRSCPSPGIKAGSATVVLTTSRFSPPPEAEGGIIRRAVGKSVGWSKSEICREGSQF